MLSNGVICFSHLRWNFVYQRPNHLMARASREGTVLFVEEPVFDDGEARPVLTKIQDRLCRLVPHLPEGMGEQGQHAAIREMVRTASSQLELMRPVHWFYTPMMLPIADGLSSCLTVYDCMDELSNFAFAPPALKQREAALMAKAGVMFTGGMALYEAKRAKHPNVHGVPSSVDTQFFARAREKQVCPADLAGTGRPRIGYCGVIDERLDLALLGGLASARPSWQFVMLGPVVKLDPTTLPQGPNIHYLGAKPYEELPRHLSGWDVAFMPFALNDATRFISPTKTPEFLAAGLPVVSTAIRDVVEPYERLGLVRIGRDAQSFLAHLDDFVAGDTVDEAVCAAFLANVSWDDTWQRMVTLLNASLARPQVPLTSVDLGSEEVFHV